MQVSGPNGPLIRDWESHDFELGPRSGRGRFCKGRVERVSERGARFGEEVSVPITRDSDRRVTEVRLHLFEMAAGGDEERRARVPQVVESNVPEAGPLPGAFVVTAPEVVMMDRAPSPAVKSQPSAER